MSRENFIGVPCLHNRFEICPPECPWFKRNKKHLKKVTFNLRTREFGGIRHSFEKEGFTPDFETLCGLIQNPDGWHPSLVEGQFLRFLPAHKEFGDYLARIRKEYVDKHGSPEDPKKALCSVKRAE